MYFFTYTVPWYLRCLDGEVHGWHRHHNVREHGGLDTNLRLHHTPEHDVLGRQPPEVALGPGVGRAGAPAGCRGTCAC
jgi:hypothetical protein